MHANEPADLSIYDKLRRTDEELEAWLVSGAHHRELVAQLGEAEYELLAPLARAAAVASIDPSTQVFILPGIMGSQLGRIRAPPWPANLVWIDPSDIVAGRLAELRLPDGGALVAMGAINFTYLALKLRLKAAGFAVQIFDYDWRHSILQQGELLATRLRAEPAQRVTLLAHSMGGLVARAALARSGGAGDGSARDDLANVTRVITLGTPHNGTFAPLQALRGTYPSVRRLAALDVLHTAEQLSHDVFNTLPSLYEMLPHAGVVSAIDLFAAESWPGTGPQPQQGLLHSARHFQARLASGDERYTSIIGTGNRTVTGLTRVGDEFEYRVTSAGDGTVPMVSATLDGADNRYVRCEHSALPRDAKVAAAVIALLDTGQCELASTPALTPPHAVNVSDAQLRETYATKIDWRTLSAEERRRYFNQLNLAPPQYDVAAS
jgi:pimeloyl-ACP methyl ester carboxylesterase